MRAREEIRDAMAAWFQFTLGAGSVASIAVMMLHHLLCETRAIFETGPGPLSDSEVAKMSGITFGITGLLCAGIILFQKARENAAQRYEPQVDVEVGAPAVPVIAAAPQQPKIR